MTTSRHGGPSGLQIGMRLAEKAVNPVVFGVPQDRMVFAPRSEGGVGQNFGARWDKATFRYLSNSAVFSPRESDPTVPNGKKRGGRERPPPKWGGM